MLQQVLQGMEPALDSLELAVAGLQVLLAAVEEEVVGVVVAVPNPCCRSSIAAWVVGEAFHTAAAAAVRILLELHSLLVHSLLADVVPGGVEAEEEEEEEEGCADCGLGP